MRILALIFILTFEAHAAWAEQVYSEFESSSASVSKEANVQGNDNFDQNRSQVQTFVDDLLMDQKSLSSKKPNRTSKSRAGK